MIVIGMGRRCQSCSPPWREYALSTTKQRPYLVAQNSLGCRTLAMPRGMVLTDHLGLYEVTARPSRAELSGTLEMFVESMRRDGECDVRLIGCVLCCERPGDALKKGSS